MRLSFIHYLFIIAMVVLTIDAFSLGRQRTAGRAVRSHTRVRRDANVKDQCTGGLLLCCSNVTSAVAPASSKKPVLDSDAVYGVNCEPIGEDEEPEESSNSTTTPSPSDSTCSTNVVCCKDNEDSDVLPVKCVVINSKSKKN